MSDKLPILAQNSNLNLLFQCQGCAKNSSPVQSNVFLLGNGFLFIRFRLLSTPIRSKTEHMCMKKDVFGNGGFRPFSPLRLIRDILCFRLRTSVVRICKRKKSMRF